jgi:alpha-ketoglutarate-dependent taurine dioxygenase
MAPRKTGTRYSRTNEPIPPHTDSSFDTQPHELVAFQCVTHDEHGGESILVPIEDILAHLDDDVIALLRETVYPLGEVLHPILSGARHQEEIRYYRTQINQALTNGTASLSEDYRAAIDALDAVLARSELFHTVHLRSGEILFMQNRKVLHGRTGFSGDSKRYLYRIRLRAPSLSLSATGAKPGAEIEPAREYVTAYER